MSEIIRIQRQTLSDGSPVFNLLLPSHWLGAISKQDAEQAAEVIRFALSNHTNDEFEVSRNY